MTQETFDKWVAALGEYTQGEGHLRIDNTYCCLGVLADVLDPNGWGDVLGDDALPGHRLGYKDCDYLDPDQVGLPLELQRILAGTNDGERYKKRTFDRIAKILQRRKSDFVRS